ncbi:4'-phosphopantetheinyl transferase superfamily protein [Gramella sp. KN1008]|uniref:4'-phosphopantetheinyl transferase family protein n=1 Tax=Gramella sp. KN1008 TaxID=2529298 RepID=UPI001040B6D3|nr:4'-phosphopantetheinyl transferase superfamily protein [Gramella sp. KN1008]TBW29206.1 4-phosphopantetheinyl transferase family protein [Gramella sp. KN1008]
MIGNDIIDLRLSLSEKKSENQRFMAKVFTDEEKGFIRASDDPETILWLLWSMKEAAYKAHQRNYGLPRTLNPQSFSCTVNPFENMGKVYTGSKNYNVEFEVNSDYIYSQTSTQSTFHRIYSKVKPTKDQILEEICASLDLECPVFRLEKDSKGIPSLIGPNPKKKLPLSLSHHGNFTAFAIPLINS